MPLGHNHAHAAGYAFLNFSCSTRAKRGFELFAGHTFTASSAQIVRRGRVSIARIQGLAANIKNLDKLEAAMSKSRRVAIKKAKVGASWP